MNATKTRIALAITLVTAALATPAFAASTAETHAWLEGQRTLTDGQVTPLDTRTAARGAVTVSKPSAEDRRFLAELARTEGNTAPVTLDADPTALRASWVDAFTRLFK